MRKRLDFRAHSLGNCWGKCQLLVVPIDEVFGRQEIDDVVHPSAWCTRSNRNIKPRMFAIKFFCHGQGAKSGDGNSVIAKSDVHTIFSRNSHHTRFEFWSGSAFGYALTFRSCVLSHVMTMANITWPSLKRSTCGAEIKETPGRTSGCLPSPCRHPTGFPGVSAGEPKGW